MRPTRISGTIASFSRTLAANATLVWPDDRKKVVLGTIRLTSVDPKSAETEKGLAYDPTHLTDGIELSDDPLPAFRAQVYSLSIARRQAGRSS